MAMAYLKEYVFETDAEHGQVLRHWTAPRETPAHINSDVCVSNRELILLDSVYACQLSADQTLLFTANRGLNTITVHDYPSNTVRQRVHMPELRQYVDGLSWRHDPRLGFHHSTLVSPREPEFTTRAGGRPA